MIFTGGKIFKSFSSQQCFSFAGEFYFYNTSGSHSLLINAITGVSSNLFGEKKLINFYSGKVFDFNNRRIYSYRKDEPILISGDVCSGRYSLYVNNDPIIFDDSVCSFCLAQATFDKFVITGNSQLDFTLDLGVQKIPQTSISLDKNLYATGENIKFFLRNESDENWNNFKVYSGNFTLNNLYRYTGNFQSLTGADIKPGSSGFFFLDYDNTSSPSYRIDENGGVQNINGTVNLETSFGSVSKNFSIPLYILDNSYYLIDFYNTYSGLFSENKILWSFDLDRKSCSGSKYLISVNRGDWYNQSGFDQLVYLESGTVIGDNVPNFSGVLPLQNSIKVTGFLPASGCGENEPSYKIRHNIYYTIENALNRNNIYYTVSGIDESFLFSGLLET
jgi:hypothetical protein